MKTQTYSCFRKTVMAMAVVLTSIFSFSQTKINDGTVGGSSLPDNSAILEIESSNKGLLLSRVSLTNTSTWGLVGATPVAGMMVYNTNASIASSSTSYPVIAGGIGCYYWDGTGWVGIKMELPLAAGDDRYWKLTGNASTSSAANFLGTTDNNPLVLKVNNIKSGYLDNNATGTTAFGYSTITNNLTGTYTGTDNTAIGSLALQNLTEGSWNTAIGKNALQAITTGGTNTAVGQFALGSLQTGWNNTAVGQSALGANTGSSNTAVGQAALRYNTSGANNIGIGASALVNNTTGNYNTAIGQDALNVNVTGSSNVGIGSSALRNTTASNNIAIGQNTLLATTSGGNNTAIGHQALTNNTTGTDNTIIGYSAGSVLTTGSNNILIGSSVNATAAGVSNTMNIGNTVYATGMNAATRKVGINTNAPTSTLHTAGSLSMAIATTAANLTLDDTHYTVIITGSTPTITLPAAGATNTGRIYVIVNQTGGARTISSYLSFTGAGTTTVAANSSITIQSNGTSWYRTH